MQARVPTAKSFFIVHHTQQLAAAAKVGDATARQGSGRREGDPEEDHLDEDAPY
jgi:hypothetical protein